MEKEMLTKEELKIIELFRNDLFKEYTIREIAKEIKKKSYSWVFNGVRKLGGKGIININVRGKSSLCSINLDNLLTLSFFSLLEKARINDSLPIDNIFELIDSIPASYFTFIVAGSYAEGTANKKSDLDIVVIVEHKEDSKKVFTILKNKGELMIPPVHLYVFTKDEFLKMLLEKEENYGKMVFRNRVIVFGAENYYLIIKEAIKSGFKG